MQFGRCAVGAAKTLARRGAITHCCLSNLLRTARHGVQLFSHVCFGEITVRRCLGRDVLRMIEDLLPQMSTDCRRRKKKKQVLQPAIIDAITPSGMLPLQDGQSHQSTVTSAGHERATSDQDRSTSDEDRPTSDQDRSASAVDRGGLGLLCGGGYGDAKWIRLAAEQALHSSRARISPVD